MQSQQPKGAIQLIAFDQNKNPYLTEDALQHLRSFQVSNLHVIAVAGKYRTGKSYILNRVLLNQSNGFKVGHTINACTKGLWMWPQLIRFGDKECLIIDTEGLGSLEEGESTDLKIFLLALLFSSYLIYNSVGKIDEQALQNLNLVIQLANILQKQDRYDTQQLINTFPSFMWLLRDFSLKLENQQGDVITTTQYLEQALRHQSRTTQPAERKNQIRVQIKTFFQNRDCFALVRPTQEQKDLHALNTLPQAKLRPQFVKLIQELRQHICRAVKPKKVRGRPLSMQGFIQLCKYYTKALVDGKLPAISSHWDNLCFGETQRIFQRFQNSHLKALQQIAQVSPKLHTRHKQIVKLGLQAIDKSFLGKLEKQLFSERFEKKMENQYQQIKIRFNNKKNTMLRSQLQNIDIFSENRSNLVEKYEDLIQKLMEITEKNNGNDQCYCELFLYLSQQARHFVQDSQARKKEIERIMNEKLQFLQSNIIIMRQNRQKDQQKYEKQIRQLKTQNKALKSGSLTQRKSKEQTYITQLFIKKQELKGLKAQISQLTNSLEQKDQINANLQQSLKSKEKFISQLQESLQKIEVQLAKKEQLLREEGIKIRKLIRERQIVKNRYQEHLQENLQLRNLVDQMEIKNSQIQLKRGYCGEKQLVKQLQQLRSKLKNAEGQSRAFRKLINDQKNTFETMLLTPQNKSIFAIKRNLQLVTYQKQIIQQKLTLINKALLTCQTYKCLICRQTVSGKLLNQHFKLCQIHRDEIQFDVSYQFNQNGQIFYQIQIEIRLKNWITSKSLQEINIFIEKYRQNMKDDALGPQKFLLQSQIQSSQKQKLSLSLDTFQNLNEQRRAFMDELLHSLKPKLFQDGYLCNFLQFDKYYFGILQQQNNSYRPVYQPLHDKNEFASGQKQRGATQCLL